MPALTTSNPDQDAHARSGARRGQALVETALVLPLLLILAFGVIGVGRLTQAQMALRAVAREAARSAATAVTPDEASVRGLTRGQEVAAGYGLNNGSLELEVAPGFMLRGDLVRASARYVVALQDLPLLGWVRVPLASEQTERVDLYRSRWTGGGAP